MNQSFFFCNNTTKLVLSFLLLTQMQSCASSSSMNSSTDISSTFKERAFQYALVGGILGGAYGVSRKDLKSENAAMYGSIGAAVGGAVALMTDNTDKEIRELKAKVKFFDDVKFNKVSSDLNQDLPDEYKQILKTHHYDVYKINEWSMRGPKLLVKESEIIEIKDKKQDDE